MLISHVRSCAFTEIGGFGQQIVFPQILSTETLSKTFFYLLQLAFSAWFVSQRGCFFSTSWKKAMSLLLIMSECHLRNSEGHRAPCIKNTSRPRGAEAERKALFAECRF
jgi:hypothetical protein